MHDELDEDDDFPQVLSPPDQQTQAVETKLPPSWNESYEETPRPSSSSNTSSGNGLSETQYNIAPQQDWDMQESQDYEDEADTDLAEFEDWLKNGGSVVIVP